MHICGDVLSPLPFPIWKTLDRPKNMTLTEQGRGKRGMWEHHWRGRREMKISTKGWKRDGLLIVCFGSLDWDICEMLHVLNFLSLCFMPDSYVHCTDCLFIQPILKSANVSLNVWNLSISLWQAADFFVCTVQKMRLIWCFFLWFERPGCGLVSPAACLYLSFIFKWTFFHF